MMAHVDVLSQNTHYAVMQDSVLIQFLKALEEDNHIAAIKAILRDASHDDFIIRYNLLYKTINGSDLLVISENNTS